MKWDEFADQVVAACRNVGILDPIDQAVVLAVCEQESRVNEDDVSTLALVCNNLFGIKAVPGDGYTVVLLPPNEFESDPQEYRCYDSMGESILNFMWHMDKSRHYRPAKIRGWEFRLRESMGIWCNNNADHSRDVVRKYRKWVERLSNG